MDKITVQSVTSKVPAAAIRKRFGVKDRSIRLAHEREMFPASWYRGIKELCAKHGAEFSDDLFNWKSPNKDEPRAATIKRGNARAPVQEQASEKVNGVSP